MKRTTWTFVIISLIFFSCEKSNLPNSKTIGANLIESDARIIMIDTFKVELSTVIIDSMVTSGFNQMLVGNYSDGEFGIITAQSYFEIGLPTAEYITSESVFDSLELVLHFSGYSYGDTTQLQTMKVYRLSEPMVESSTGYFYNTTQFARLPEILGQKDFHPEFSESDELTIKIDAVFAVELFNFFKINHENVSAESYFLDYFNGIVLESNSQTNAAIVGYSGIDTSAYFRYYYMLIRKSPQVIPSIRNRGY